MKKLIYLFTISIFLSLSLNSIAQDSTDVYGCMDPAGLNYNPLATIDNGYCVYYCDSTSAYFWYPAITDSAIYVQSFAYSLSPITAYFWDFGDGTTSTLESPTHFYNEEGLYTICFTVTALGEDPLSVCTTTFCDSVYAPAGTILNVNSGLIYGCTDPAATNYNPLANVNNGSCVYDNSEVYGCMDSTAINYNPLATIDDGSCIYTEVYGCTDSSALNYNPLATINDGSCIYNDTTYIYGCTDPLAINYNPLANMDDGSCIYIGDSTAVFGCTDTSALNYNPLATIDDGSCSYYCDSTAAYFYVSSIDEATGIIYVVNNSYSLDPITEFIWDFGDGQTSNEEFPVHEYESEGFYMLCLTILSEAPNGFMVCTSTYCDTIGISQMMLKSNGMTLNVISELATGIEQQIQNISDINLYPNPANNNITLSYNVKENEMLTTTIYDVSGRTISSSSSIPTIGYNRVNIDLSDLTTGMYQIELRNKNSRNILRFQVIK